jgi:hypothetical protein
VKVPLGLRARVALLLGSVSVLAAAVVASFFGPVAVLTFGPPPAGTTLELDLLDLTIGVSALLVGAALWRGPRSLSLAVIVGAVVSLGIGFELSWGIWIPTGAGGWSGPFTLQGALLGLWGLCTLLLGFVAYVADSRTIPVDFGAPRSAR